MATTHHPAHDHCTICGEPTLHCPAVPTTRGERVHITCAAYRRRTTDALLSGLVVVAIVIVAATCGTLMGNRGCLHDGRQRIVRAYAVERWIICRLAFKGWHRQVMTPGRYTELFFLDEATALAAGHRPCAASQHRRFTAFRAHWAAAHPDRAGRAVPGVDIIDAALHRERQRLSLSARQAQPDAHQRPSLALRAAIWPMIRRPERAYRNGRKERTTMLPSVIHTYQNHLLDSTRWERFTPRAGDIVLATPYKFGTTWTQEIVLHLVFRGQQVPYREAVSPWLDARFEPLEAVLTLLEAQRHRRVIKTHLALDGLPFAPPVQYIVVGRDPRDVCMSMWNHYSSHTPAFFAFVNGLPGRVGAPFPPAPADIHTYWCDWISRGWFAWEQEGYPHWGNMHHLQSWWAYRHVPNILLVHFADLLADTPGQIRRIADYLAISASDEQVAQIAQQTSLTAMRTRAEQNDPGIAKNLLDGARSFFYQGTNGRWRGVLRDAELAMYQEKAIRVLTPDCRAWLEHGRSA